MSSNGDYSFHDFKPGREDMAAEVLRGITGVQKYITPKFFYDEKGSVLFEQITTLPEYYLTRTEMALFDAKLPEISSFLPADLCVIEYGSGSSLKIRKLLQGLTPQAYVPVDISDEHLQQNARLLHADFSDLNVYPVCADFTHQFQLPEAVQPLQKFAFFPGSSIGNFEPEAARGFLINVREAVEYGGFLLIGVDRKKARQVLEAAYDDASGITAAFNLNVLSHLNTELNSNFDLNGFEHVASYDADAGCICMFLRSLVDQDVQIAGEKVSFSAGEHIHTENSYKYHPQEFIDLAASAGFEEVARYTDVDDQFGLYLLRGR